MKMLRLTCLVGILGFVGCHEITDVSPHPAAPGTQITLTGRGWGGPSSTKLVTYDSEPVTITSWSAEQIVATLPHPKPDGTYTIEVVDGTHVASAQHTIVNATPSRFQAELGNSNSDEQAYCAVQAPDGGYVLAGSTRYAVGNETLSFGYVVKTDDVGALEWTYSFGGAQADGAHAVAVTADGGFIVAGGESPDMVLIKPDSDGQQSWKSHFAAPGEPSGYSVQQTTDGEYILAGHDGAGTSYLLEADAVGTELWRRTFQNLRVSTVAQTADGGYVLAGRTESFGIETSSMYLVKTDANGDSGPPP